MAVERRDTRLVLTLALVNLLCFLLVWLYLARVVPPMVRIYEDLRAALPMATRLFVLHQYGWFQAVLVVGILSVLVGSLIRRPYWRVVFCVLPLLTLVLFLVVHGLSLVLPLAGLQGA